MHPRLLVVLREKVLIHLLPMFMVIEPGKLVMEWLCE